VNAPPARAAGGAPVDPEELHRFLESFLYREEVFLLSDVRLRDDSERRIDARLDTCQTLPIARYQRVTSGHPAHVSAADMLILTGNLGCLHAWFFHGCRWDRGWAGFGTRIHRAAFRSLARLGPPLLLESRETRARVGPRRVVLRIEFTFRQEDRVVYEGDQSAMFVKDRDLGGSGPAPP
jgi:hypothetical protein